MYSDNNSSSQASPVAVSSSTIQPPSNADDPDKDLIILQIPHDLCIQLVGSDSGKQRRIRPHGAMLQGASTEEVELAATALQPILNLEIKRVHEGVRYSERLHQLKVNREVAVVLKGFCLRFAADQRQHLDKDPGNERLHRTRQRLTQALNVIRQIDLVLGMPIDHILKSEAKAEAIHSLRQALTSLKAFINLLDPRDSQVSGMTNLVQSMESILLEETV